MPIEYLRDGDTGFIGLNSRDNSASLPKGIVSKSQNFRLDRGVATVRKGIRRLTSTNILNKTIYGTGTYIDGSGQEIFVIVVTNGVHTFNPETEIFSTLIPFPTGETITTRVGCDVVTAVDKIYISRGHSKRPLVCTIDTSTYLISGIAALTSLSNADGHNFPNCSGLLYYANRLIAIGRHPMDNVSGGTPSYTPTARSRDSICVSNYLDFNNWELEDMFMFNEGGNDEVIAIAPWTLTEFVVFLRNSIFYVNVGTGRFVYSDPMSATTASMKSLVSDIGCKAKNSIVLAGGGIIFLSDNGIYVMNPTQVGSNESIRLLTSSDPLSSPIDDIIQRINKSYIQNSVGVYWNNRYYLAVPLDQSSDNNCVLVFNFLIKNWESIDTYPFSLKTGVPYFSSTTTGGTVYVSSPSHGLISGQVVNVINSTIPAIPNANYNAIVDTVDFFHFTLSPSATITFPTGSYTGSASIVTVTTATAHNLTTGDILNIVPTTSTAWTAGNYTVTVLSSTSFTFVPLSYSNASPKTLSYYKLTGTLQTYQGFDVINFSVGKKSNQRRLFGFDTDQGVFILEELEYDEYGASTGKPILPYTDESGLVALSTETPIVFPVPPSTNYIYLNPSAFTPNNINGELITRTYTYNDLKDKRFSTAEVDLFVYGGSSIETQAETTNPDVTAFVDYYDSASDEDATRRIAIRKIAYGLKLKIYNKAYRISVRGTNIISTLMGKQNISKK